MERITRKQTATLAGFNRPGSVQYCGSWWHIATLAQNKLITARLLQSRDYEVSITDAGRDYLKAQS
jgi:hypothetical protein